MKPIEDVKLDNFTYYGRFDKKKIRPIGNPAQRSGFKVKNKIFYNHFEDKKKMMKSQGKFFTKIDYQTG